jgi:hypothetical protein
MRKVNPHDPAVFPVFKDSSPLFLDRRLVRRLWPAF